MYVLCVYCMYNLVELGVICNHKNDESNENDKKERRVGWLYTIYVSLLAKQK